MGVTCVCQESQWERDGNLSRFQGSSSISSAEYFGGDAARLPRNSAFSVSAPDLDEVSPNTSTAGHTLTPGTTISAGPRRAAFPGSSRQLVWWEDGRSPTRWTDDRYTFWYVFDAPKYIVPLLRCRRLYCIMIKNYEAKFSTWQHNIEELDRLNSYRPIPILSTLSKLVERLMNNRIFGQGLRYDIYPQSYR